MRRLPLHGWLGLGLLAVYWYLNWTLDGPRTHLLFFPLWLGYVLAVDGLVLRRSGTSLLTRSGPDLAALFAVSVPIWWLFELLNRHLRSWLYVGAEEITGLQYAPLRQGDWRPAVALALGALVCGFLWELWNSRSLPYWVYDTPGWDFWHLFQMPAFGYFGYLPFGLELYPLAHLLMPWRPDLRLGAEPALRSSEPQGAR